MNSRKKKLKRIGLARALRVAAKKKRLRAKRLRRLTHRRRHRIVSASKPKLRTARERYLINREAVRSVDGSGQFSAQFPARFSLLENPAETLDFFRETRAFTLENPTRTIVFKHGTIKMISPETAIVLIAELTLANAYTRGIEMNSERDLTHMDAAAFKILKDIGYWDYFGVIDGPETEGVCSTNVLRHVHGYEGNLRFIHDLMAHFEPDKNFGVTGRQALVSAIGECMANALEWAYPDQSRRDRTLHNHWWACGHRDDTKNEISFCVYDQGVGIPATIRRRLGDALPRLLYGRSDAEIIADAIMHGQASRTRDTTRGRGLPSLKEIFTECADAKVTVLSHKSVCEITKLGDDVNVETRNLPSELNGTLVVWNLKKKA